MARAVMGRPGFLGSPEVLGDGLLRQLALMDNQGWNQLRLSRCHSGATNQGQQRVPPQNKLECVFQPLSIKCCKGILFNSFEWILCYLRWRGKWQPTPVFLPGKSIDRGAWQRVQQDLATKQNNKCCLTMLMTGVTTTEGLSGLSGLSEEKSKTKDKHY